MSNNKCIGINFCHIKDVKICFRNHNFRLRKSICTYASVVENVDVEVTRGQGALVVSHTSKSMTAFYWSESVNGVIPHDAFIYDECLLFSGILDFLCNKLSR